MVVVVVVVVDVSCNDQPTTWVVIVCTLYSTRSGKCEGRLVLTLPGTLYVRRCEDRWGIDLSIKASLLYGQSGTAHSWP